MRLRFEAPITNVGFSVFGHCQEDLTADLWLNGVISDLDLLGGAKLLRLAGGEGVVLDVGDLGRLLGDGRVIEVRGRNLTRLRGLEVEKDLVEG